MLKRMMLLLIILMLALTACGGGDTPSPEAAPTDEPATEAPTDIPEPTDTPEPTIDPASYSAAELQATVEALEAEIEREEEHLSSASGMEAGNVQTLIDELRGDLRDVQELLDAALEREAGADDAAAEDDTGEDMAEDEADDDDMADDETDAADDEEAAEEDMAEDETGDDDMADDAEAAAGPALTLAGDFAEAREWAWDELAELEMITATIAGPREDDPEVEYTGVSLMALLEAAGVGEDATTLIATASDDFAGEIDLAAAQDCAECMVVQQEDGTLRLVMPEFPSNNWVRDVVSLTAE